MAKSAKSISPTIKKNLQVKDTISHGDYLMEN